MRRLGYLCGILFGLCLMMVSGVSHIQRRQSPPKYWVLYEKGDLENQTVYLSSPDGSDYKPLIRLKRPGNIQLLDWLPDGVHFLYQTYSQENGYQLRLYDVRSSQSTVLSESLTRTSGPRWLLLPNANSNSRAWRLIHQRSDEGAALYRINATGEIFERISPFHGTIGVNGRGIIQNDGWVYYQASDTDDDLPALYRQRMDGGQHLELLRFDGDMFFTNARENEITVQVNNYDRNDSQFSTYHIVVEGDDVLVNESEGSIFPSTPLESGWLVYGEFDGMSIQYFRQRVDSEEREVLFAPNQHQNIAGVVEETLYYTEQEDDFESLNSIDASVLAHRQLTPSQRFTDIGIVRPMRDPDGLIFEASEGEKQSIYRVNTDGSDLQLLMTFDHLNDERYFRAFGDWIVVSDSDSAVRRATTNIYRLNVKTGESEQLMTFGFRSSYIYEIMSPDFDRFILSAPNDSEIAEQYYVDVSEGVSRKVDFGHEIFFSDFPAQDFKSGLMAGVGLLIVGLSGGIGFARRSA